MSHHNTAVQRALGHCAHWRLRALRQSCTAAWTKQHLASDGVLHLVQQPKSRLAAPSPSRIQ